jgi:heterodisulfide reductase subunit A
MKAEIVVFLCKWCHKGLQFSDGIKSVEVLCSGRVGPSLILQTFELGPKGVFILGCEEERCHYIQGSLRAKESVEKVKGLFSLMGMDSQRIGGAWITPFDRDSGIKAIENFKKGIGE